MSRLVFLLIGGRRNDKHNFSARSWFELFVVLAASFVVTPNTSAAPALLSVRNWVGRLRKNSPRSSAK